MDISGRERAISSLINIISLDTSAIAHANVEIARLEESRTQAVYRLVHLMDVRFQQVAREPFNRVLADLLLLEIFKTGVSGAPTSHLFSIVRDRYGDAFTPKDVRQVLDALQRAGEAVDREHFWFAPSMFVETLPPGEVPPDTRGRIIQILDDHPEGLRVRSIIAEIKERYKVVAPQPNVASVLSKMKQSGRIRHEGKLWRLTSARNKI